MATRDLGVVVLAAGRGTRMRSDRPKLLFEAAGRPLGSWVLDAALGLRPAVVVVVVPEAAGAIAAAYE
jgi:bifunctional UDP-N-acetylglucosamine pyrophosphorylase/glucosamine-1-phosphate N-acetyltransferase